MKHPFKPLATALAATLQIAALAAVPLAWDVRPGQPAPVMFDRYHGETLGFSATFRGFGELPFAAGADVRLWYQTNGMGAAWWSAPATIRSNVLSAVWSPEMDPGAERVSLFFGAPSNAYASAVLRLRHSPGFAPASLPLPVPVLDFSTVELRNISALTNGWSFGDPGGPYLSATGGVVSGTVKVEGKVRTSAVNGHAELGRDGVSIRRAGFPFSSVVKVEWPSGNGTFARLEDIPDETDPTVPEWAKEPSPPSYSAADVGAAPASIVPVLTSVSNDAATAKLNSETALRIVLGESVWFAVTNYMRTAEGVIPSLQLWEVRDGATNLVYDSREEITNTVHALTRELRAELEARIPSKAWGNYQSDGTDNPEPGKVAIVNQPTVILTGGGTFNKYVEIGDSSIWVLTSSGPVSFGGGGANGNFFAVLDDEGNAHFKVSKTDSFDVPAIFSDNPRKSGDALLLYICSTNRQGEAYIGPPTLSACTNLQAAVWHDEADGEIDALGTSVAWARNDAIHAWVGTVTQDRWATVMFFRAKMKQEGGTAIINTAPVRFDGGIQIGNGTYRLVPYTTGGKTYLTVEGMP